MTEEEYVIVDALVRIRSAQATLRGLDCDGAPDELSAAMSALSKAERKFADWVGGAVR